MPLLDTISNLFSGLSPRRRHQHHRDTANPPPPSHDTSEQNERAQTSGVRDTPILPSGLSGTANSTEGPDRSFQVHSSYAQWDPYQKSRLVQPHMPTPPPRRFGHGFRMSRVSHQTQTSHRRPKPQSDEARLMPRYFGNDAGAVPISVGDSARSKKKNLQGFAPYRPHDSLQSRRTKESGPVRSGGRFGERHRDQSHRHTYQPQGYQRAQPEISRKGIGLPQLDLDEISRTISQPRTARAKKASEHEDSERPSKRQRQEGHSSPSGQPIALDNDDDDVMEQVASNTDASSTRNRSPVATSSSSQQSAKTKKTPRNSLASPTTEYRNIEDNLKVKKSRHTPHKESGRPPYFPARSSRTQLITMDIPEPHRATRPTDTQVPGKTHSASSPSMERRHSDAQESPDELQGEVTIQPQPTPVIRDRTKDTPNGMNSCQTTGSSPSDIRPTEFVRSPRKSDRKKPKAGKSPSETSSFEAVSVRHGNTVIQPPSGQTIKLQIDHEKAVLKIPREPGDEGIVDNLSLVKLMQITEESEPGCRIRLKTRGNSAKRNLVDIELSSQRSKTNLCSALAHPGVKVIEKASEWMDNAFVKAAKEMSCPDESQPPVPETAQESGSKQPRVDIPKRPRLVASLQDDDGNINSQNLMSTRKRAGQSVSVKPPHISKQSFGGGPQSDSHKSNADGGVEISVKPFRQNLLSAARETRSTTRREESDPVIYDVDDDDDHKAEAAPTESGKWSKPLVYPRFGKKKAEVDTQDLQRLNDNEFLNDNIIGFYIRFLEDHVGRCNPEVAKRVYFFNSYLFATLTNTPRGQRDINYAGVQKWTRNVDIFSYDYLVVPINEAAHWYVAIVCNLPNLQTPGQSPERESIPAGVKKTSSQEETGVREIPETPEPSQELGEPTRDEDSGPGKEEMARKSLATMNLGDDELKEHPVDEEWPEVGENPTSSPARFPISQDLEPEIRQKSSPGTAPSSKKKQKKKSRPSGVKYNPAQPIIVTFDSLDMLRSPTISILRNYLREESKSKKGVDLDTKLIKGMRARQIPLQPNSSDCGLYLLAYLEKFVQNPDEFISKTLRREMDVPSHWPVLRSGLLRRRLREFLDELWDEQEHTSRQATSEKTFMADRQPISYLLGPPPESEEDEDSDSSDGADKPQEQKYRAAKFGHTSKPETGPRQQNLSDLLANIQPTRLSKADQEAIQVPDSQEHDGKVTRSMARDNHKSKPGDGGKDVVKVDDGASADESSDEDTGHDAVVEVQIPSTKPPRQHMEKRTSPRSAKQKS